MPLKLKLAAHERLVVNGAVMVNGGGRTSLIIRNFAHIMREKDVLQEADANTPTQAPLLPGAGDADAAAALGRTAGQLRRS